MNKPKNFEDCFEDVPESITAANRATFCRYIGWIILVICIIAGIVLSIDAPVSGFAILTGFCIGGNIIASTFWILGAILNALASSTQSNAETARMTYWQLCANARTAPQKIQQKQKKRTVDESSSFQENSLNTEALTDFEPNTTNGVWVCTYCGVENEPWDNICNYCGKKKTE